MQALETAPVLRIFDEAVARAFYIDFLGFSVQFEHRFAPGMPLYLAVERGGLVLHLSGHHGDASPGGTVHVRITGIDAFHAELGAKRHAHCRWGRELALTDPFGNRLRFLEG